MILLDLDPNVVKPGWTPLLITIGIAVAMVFLFLSMRRQFRRINVAQFQGAGTDPVAEGHLDPAPAPVTETSPPEPAGGPVSEARRRRRPAGR
ncbi:MAG: hypothetical protein JWP61_407 [Friedmanniella sp.]|nr:hypothetical protein [Friedmanniella sp.]